MYCYSVFRNSCGSPILSPSGNRSVFFIFLSSVLHYASYLRLKVILVGDTNIDILAENTQQIEFVTLVRYNVIQTPTRVTAILFTLLGSCTTHFHSDDILLGTITAGISDHTPIYCISPNINERNSQTVSRTYRYISEETLNTFYDSLVAQNWNVVLSESNSNKSYDIFFETMLSCYRIKESGKLGLRNNFFTA